MVISKREAPGRRGGGAAASGASKEGLNGCAHPAITGAAAQAQAKKCLDCRHYDYADLICWRWQTLTLPENPAQDCFERKPRRLEKCLTNGAYHRHNKKRVENPSWKVRQRLRVAFFMAFAYGKIAKHLRLIIAGCGLIQNPLGNMPAVSKRFFGTRLFLRPLAAMKTTKNILEVSHG